MNVYIGSQYDIWQTDATYHVVVANSESEALGLWLIDNPDEIRHNVEFTLVDTSKASSNYIGEY